MLVGLGMRFPFYNEEFGIAKGTDRGPWKSTVEKVLADELTPICTLSKSVREQTQKLPASRCGVLESHVAQPTLNKAYCLAFWNKQ